jgi:hypothetical protein
MVAFVWLPAGLPGRSPNSRSGGTSPSGAKSKVTGSLSHAWRPCSGSLPVYPAGARIPAPAGQARRERRGEPEAVRPAPCRFTRQEPEFPLRRDKPVGSEEESQKPSDRLPAGLPGRSLNFRSGGTSPSGAKRRQKPSAPAPCRFTRQEPEFPLRRDKPAGSEGAQGISVVDRQEAGRGAIFGPAA